MKLSDPVLTPHGKGIIVDFEKTRWYTRAGVKLEQNPFTFPVAYYFVAEIKTLLT